MSVGARIFALVVVLGSAAWLGSKTRPPADAEDAFRIHEFGRLPVVYQGRVKPFDTLARNSLVILSDKQTFTDAEGNRQPAIRWLLDVMANTPPAYQHKVFRITHFGLHNALGLEGREGYRYAYNEFAAKLPAVEQQVMRASRLDPGQRDLYDAKLLEFWSKVSLFRNLVESHHIPHISHEPDKIRADIARAVSQYRSIESLPLPHAIPPARDGEEWKPFLGAVIDGMFDGDPNPAVQPFAHMLLAYGQGDTAGFNGALQEYQQTLKSVAAVDAPRLNFESFFNHFEPFYHCSVLYVVAFLLTVFGWLGWSKPLNRTAFWLLMLTFGVHTLAIVGRIYISGYPPITNLYGTAVFIGWACCVLGLILESIYRMGVGNTIAAVSGFLTLLIAHFLAGDGDTLQMMQAVLDTKFWLATHVVIINLGYAATFFAGGLAILYILRGNRLGILSLGAMLLALAAYLFYSSGGVTSAIWTARAVGAGGGVALVVGVLVLLGVLRPAFSDETERSFGRMIYGTICFGLLMSFVGTVLGGLWADDSWGRFWGWDPKENGALIIVLWNALVLHARWGGMVKTRGIAALAVFGNIVTSWSWFGVNQLGVGLHSYGFTDSVAFWLITFVLSQLVIIAVGMLPRVVWLTHGVAKVAPKRRAHRAVAGGSIGGPSVVPRDK